MSAIRVATEEDVPLLVEFAKQFIIEGPFNIEPDADFLFRLMTAAVRDKDSVVFVEPVKGMLFGSLVPLWFAPKTRLAVELAWFVTHRHRSSGVGIRMLAKFEEWANERGVDTVQLSTLTLNGKFLPDTLFCRLGYRPMEKCFVKDVPL